MALDHSVKVPDIDEKLMNRLLQAISAKNHIKLEQILALGASPCWTFLHHRATPLMMAAEIGDAFAIESLLPTADANQVDEEGNTALMVAARFGEPEAVAALLAHTDVGRKVKSGRDAGMDAFLLALDKVERGGVPFARCALLCARRRDMDEASRDGSRAWEMIDRARSCAIGMSARLELSEIEAMLLSARESREISKAAPGSGNPSRSAPSL